MATDTGSPPPFETTRRGQRLVSEPRDASVSKKIIDIKSESI
jgi:hypothetical protein